MKLASLAFKNALRSKRRTILTVLSIAFFAGVICFMHTVLKAFESWEGQADLYSRVAVMSKVNLTNNLPPAHMNYLETLPDVSTVNRSDWFGGMVSDRQEDFFANFASDPENWNEIWEELKIDPAQYKAYCENRQGALVGRSLAKRFDWKIGSRVTLRGTIYPVNPELTIVAMFDGPNKNDENQFMFHWEYFNQLMDGKASVGVFWLKVKTKEAVPRVMEEVDRHFENTNDPTKSMTEKEFARMFASMMGDIGLLVRSIGVSVVVLMILIVANTLAMSARERAVETSAMRVLGFGRRAIVGMVLFESMLVTVAGALLGVGIPVLLFNGFKLSMGAWFPEFPVANATIILSAAIAGTVGLTAGLFPAWLNARLPIVEGLRRVG